MPELIDEAFIAKWQPQYDRFARDQTAYEQLVRLVDGEISRHGSLTRPTFIRLIEWKSPRIRPIFERRDYAEYREGVAAALLAPEDEKLPALDALHGIGAPVASTILHFIYPDDYPIIDFRTARALYQFGLITSPVVSGKKYPGFRKAILEIREKTGGYSLREIDLALFTFHKVKLSEKLSLEK